MDRIIFHSKFKLSIILENIEPSKKSKSKLPTFSKLASRKFITTRVYVVSKWLHSYNGMTVQLFYIQEYKRTIIVERSCLTTFLKFVRLALPYDGTSVPSTLSGLVQSIRWTLSSPSADKNMWPVNRCLHEDILRKCYDRMSHILWLMHITTNRPGSYSFFMII